MQAQDTLLDLQNKGTYDKCSSRPPGEGKLINQKSVLVQPWWCRCLDTITKYWAIGEGWEFRSQVYLNMSGKSTCLAGRWGEIQNVEDPIAVSVS